jgi:GNAT superfamily N-acetyltransferase
VRADDLPGVYDLNVAVWQRPAEAGEIVAELERTRGDLQHDKLLVPDVDAGRALRPDLEAAGFDATELVVMRWAGDDVPARARAREASAADLRWLRIEATSADVAQLLERYAAAVPTRFFAAPDDDPMAYCALFRRDGIAQIEEVMTLERAQGKGYAGAVMAAAIEAGSDADLLFLTADADDWVPGWYARLGFEEIGRRFDFTRGV